MLLTELDAQQKACPVGSGVRHQCIGSQCMAWRCVPGQQFHQTKIDKVTMLVRVKASPDLGYCGLAGRPE